MRLLLLALGLILSACTPAPEPPAHGAGGTLAQTTWQAFRADFVRDDGQVVDTGNQNISHSEGQGYAMLLAVAADDAQSFERIWSWTQNHLPRRADGLFSWRWSPHTTPAVSDPNNASDGDLLIAWALARASIRWQREDYRQSARNLARSLREHLIRQTSAGAVLLPGMEGFEHPAGITINLAYWVFPAFADMDLLDPSPLWSQLEQNGQRLINTALFGSHALPADWLLVKPDGSLAPAPTRPARFGFEAMRIPLYACWGKIEAPSLYARLQLFWSCRDSPAWLDLNTGESASYTRTPGHLAVWRMMQHCLPEEWRTPDIAVPNGEQDYYARVLIALSELAENERKGTFINSIKPMDASQKPAKKHSIFEPILGAKDAASEDL